MSPAAPCWLAISLHDVSPATEQQCKRLIELVQRCVPQAPLTLLIIPQYRGSHAIDRALHWRRWIDARIAGGDEAVLHGLTHVDDGRPPRTPAGWFSRRIMTNGEGEFSTLSTIEARRRIERGLQLFARCGWRATGFVPPAWLIGADARAALADFGFAYTTTRTTLYRLPEWSGWRYPSLVFSSRSPLQRRLSFFYNAVLQRSQRKAALLRIALHPVDAESTDCLRAWEALLVSAARGRTAVTKAQATALLGAALPPDTGIQRMERLRHNRPATP